MVNSRRLRQTMAFVLLGLTASLFQNCGKGPAVASSNQVQSLTSSIQVVGTASSFTQVTYSSQSGAMMVDLEHGLINRSCSVGSDPRLSEMSAILSSARVCKEAVMAEGEIRCMAIAQSDIGLDSPTEHIDLTKVDYCKNGTFLCDGDTDRLRAILVDLQANPPSCQ